MKKDVKRQEWFEFKPGSWTREVNVRSFIQNNYTPYEKQGRQRNRAKR